MTANPKITANHLGYVLIAGNSGTMLAKAVFDAGYLPLVIDLYADFDTYQYAAEVFCIPALNHKYLISAINNLKKHYFVGHAVYGSGFENAADCIALLAENFTLLGNSFAVFGALLDKTAFFSTLHSLTIPYPESQFYQPTEQQQDWLFKPRCGAGGMGITRADNCNAESTEGYWQKYQPGKPHSVLFLADGQNSQIVGFNEQWTTAINEHEKFVFSGIINATKLTTGHKRRISIWVNNLVREYNLIGLNSLDFIQYGDETYVLEINPRPPASMQLYDIGLLTQHIAACQGQLTNHDDSQNGLRAYQVIYAHNLIKIPDDMTWPEGAVNLPVANSQINTGQPICSIIAQGETADKLRAYLNQKQEFIVNQLEKSISWNIPPALTN